jgi:hypothetical protein
MAVSTSFSLYVYIMTYIPPLYVVTGALWFTLLYVYACSEFRHCHSCLIKDIIFAHDCCICLSFKYPAVLSVRRGIDRG